MQIVLMKTLTSIENLKKSKKKDSTIVWMRQTKSKPHLQLRKNSRKLSKSEIQPICSLRIQIFNQPKNLQSNKHNSNKLQNKQMQLWQKKPINDKNQRCFCNKWKLNWQSVVMSSKKRKENRLKHKEKCNQNSKRKNKSKQNSQKKKSGRNKNCLKKKNSTIMFKMKLKIVAKS